jgi:hypothetical protein
MKRRDNELEGALNCSIYCAVTAAVSWIRESGPLTFSGWPATAPKLHPVGLPGLRSE